MIKLIDNRKVGYINKTILASMLLLCFIASFGQSILFVNQGEMSIRTDAKLFVDGGVNFQTDNVRVILDGTMLLTGDFVNDVTAGNVFDGGSGSVEFIGNEQQHITGVASKELNYIAFPNVRIEKDLSDVALDSKMGADMQQLNLTSGKLILKSDREMTPNSILHYNDYSNAIMAHLRVNDVIYNRSEIKQKGVVEVEMQLSDLDRKNKIFGFTSPYKAMYNDYFFANYLSSPSEKGLWGDDTTSIIDPESKMMAGKGYIAGQNILPEDRYTLDAKWGDATALHNARFTDKVVFNRYALAAPIATVNNKADQYGVEELNTGDVVVSLKKGWQYIGNPFTSPLNMDGFITATSSTTDAWKVARPTDNSTGVSPRFWVMGTGNGVLDNWTPDRFQIQPTWLVHQKVGSTLERETNASNSIAPMQMVAIYANEATSITIPASERTHALRKVAQVVTDEMLLEVGNAQGFDRLALVFRSGASLSATDVYDVPKMVDSLASAGQIFTISSEGYAMTTNVIPSSIKSVEMGMIPTLDAQNKTLTAHRIASLVSVSQVWLEDRVTGGAWVDLKTTSGYTFVSKPSDRIDRFVIHINVAANSQSIPAQALPMGLFATNHLPSASVIAASSTAPVGGGLTDQQFELTSDLICEGSEGFIDVSPTLLKVKYEVFDAPKNGNSKGNELGTGTKVHINSGAISTSGLYYVSALSTDGLISVNRPRSVQLNFIKSMIYPDIRATVCPGAQTIQLSKYLDTTYFKTVIWEKQTGLSTLVGDKLQMMASDSGTQSLRYTVTDVCKTAAPARFYLTTRANRKMVDTIVMCYETAEALQLNQVFGLEDGGTIAPELATLSPEYFTISQAPQVFAGATTFSGKKAYLTTDLLPVAPAKYGAGAKVAVFKYTPVVGSCFPQSEYKLVIIFTESIL